MSADLLKKLICFAVLMESGKGIMAKDPGYIMQKWGEITVTPPAALLGLLDLANRAKYVQYLRNWELQA